MPILMKNKTCLLIAAASILLANERLRDLLVKGKKKGKLSYKEIAAAVKEQMKLDVDKKKIVLKENIKTLGTHIVNVKLHPEVTAELKVVVKEEA